MHIFKFSPRKDTRAAVMDGQLSEDIKNKRSDILLDLALEGAGRYMKSHIGRTEEVLLEEEKTILGKRYMIGHTPDYIPVAVPSEGQVPGDIVGVTLSGMLTDEIMK